MNYTACNCECQAFWVAKGYIFSEGCTVIGPAFVVVPKYAAIIAAIASLFVRRSGMIVVARRAAKMGTTKHGYVQCLGFALLTTLEEKEGAWVWN